MSRRALVTGASGGIGSAIARRLAADGFTVAVGYGSSKERATAVVNGLAGTGHEAIRVDVCDPASIDAARDAIGPGPLDVLVNCAGTTERVAHDDLDGLTDDIIDRILTTNVRGQFAVIRGFASALRAAEVPVIVNISSVAAVSGQGSNVAYCASKAALDSLTRSLGRALAPKIRVVSVSPGWVLGEYAAAMPPGMLQTQESLTPLGRLATADDVAGAVSAVVNDLPFTTGAIIPVDGGRPLGVS